MILLLSPILFVAWISYTTATSGINIFNYRLSAQAALDNYCKELKNRNLVSTSESGEGAVHYFGNRITNKYGEDAINHVQLSNSLLIDITQNGGIADCIAHDVHQTEVLATGAITFTYGNQQASTHYYHLFNSNNYNNNPTGWVIDTSYWKASSSQY